LWSKFSNNTRKIEEIKMSKKLDIPQNKIALVEDTVETLDNIAKTRDYFTVHVSSFFD